MKPPDSQSAFCKPVIGSVTAVLCGIVILTLVPSLALAQQAQDQAMTTATPTGEAAPEIPNDQLDSLVAPIALYPDPLLGQTLAASTYPLEMIQLQQWMDRNKNLKNKALADAVEKQNWDPSVQAMAAFPELTQRLAGNIQWTTDLGNAFLAQQSDVMDAVQRMRAKAQSKGALQTGAQQKVETQTVEGGKQVSVIQQASPEVVYVPSYDPVVVYGTPPYPYPSYYYPGYVPGMALSFGAGLALGAAWGGGWGYGCGWGHNDVNVNVNNKYVNHYNKTNINNKITSGNWQHHAEHRGNAPYGNRQTANKYAGAGNRSGAGGAGTMNRPGAGGGDRIGGRTPSAGGGGGAFGGGGMSGSSARSASSRGSYSMGGGGFSGGGRGGGGRGGGGRGG